MPEDYLELYKLETTENPFQVQRIVDEEQQESEDCVLPDNIGPVLDLPDLNITMPDLECKTAIDIPIIPPPFFETCFPTFTSDVSLTSCNPDIGLTGSLSIEQTASCEYNLTGNLEVCYELPVGVCASGLNVSVGNVEGTAPAEQLIPIFPMTAYPALIIEPYIDGTFEQVSSPCGYSLKLQLDLTAFNSRFIGLQKKTIRICEDGEFSDLEVLAILPPE